MGARTSVPHDRIRFGAAYYHEYHRPGERPGGKPVELVHVDAYRLGDGPDALDELDALDLDTDLTAAVVVVEWGEGLVEKLTDRHLRVRLRRDPESDVRRATWGWVG